MRPVTFVGPGCQLGGEASIVDDAPLTDEQLVERARDAGEGDVRAFDQLVHRHQRQVMANCRHLTRSASDAEDLAQEVFVKAFFGLGRFEGRASFKTWINRIKVNHCLNFLKKKENQVFVDTEDEDLAHAPGMQVDPAVEARQEAASQRERIVRVLDSMGDTLRIPLILRDFDKLSYQEIAEQLGLGLSATKMRIKRARETFRELYRALEAEEGGPR